MPKTPNKQNLIQLNSKHSSRAARPVLVTRPQQNQYIRTPLILKAIDQDSLILDQSILIDRNHLLLNQNSHQFRTASSTRNQSRLFNQIEIQEEDQVLDSPIDVTPIYKVIRIPFLARSFPQPPCVKKKLRKTNVQEILNQNETKSRAAVVHPQEQVNTSVHSNSLNQRNQSYTQLIKNETQRNQLNIANTTDTLKTATTTSSFGKMMGLQLPGTEFQECLNGVLQIAEVEELFAPMQPDDYFIETIDNSDLEANKEDKYGLGEMTINQMRKELADRLDQASKMSYEEEFMKDVPGEESFYSIPRMPYSEELISLTQPSFEHEAFESNSYFAQTYDNDIYTYPEDSDNSSSFIAISPGSPLPTESDCIATSELHNIKYDSGNSTMDQTKQITLLTLPSPSVSASVPSPPTSQNGSIKEEETFDIEQILQSFEYESRQQQPKYNRKRSNNHQTNSKITNKKARLSIPIHRTAVDIGMDNNPNQRIPDTPEVCNMVYDWLTEDNGFGPETYTLSPSWSDTSSSHNDTTCESSGTILENTPSKASSIISELAYHAAPSPTRSSSSTTYSTYPNSPASVYGSGSRKPRGRPPKQHSDLPDPTILQNLSELERKRYEDRCKNNEASRQSRQKNKEKQMTLLAEEEELQHRNTELKNKLKVLDLQHRKLRKALQRRFNKTNNV